MPQESPPPKRPGRITRLVVSAFLLAPLILTSSLFAFTAEGRALAIDSALSIGLGGDVNGSVRFEDCTFYIDGDPARSKSTDRSTRCAMIIEAEGERVVRPIDLDHIEPLEQVRQPGRIFGALGAAMPAGVIFDRLGRFGTLIFMSLFCSGGLIYLLWSTRRRAVGAPVS